MSSSQRVKSKSTCCQSRPRCKRCPVVLRRLEQSGRAQSVGKRTYELGSVPKRELKTARAR